MRRFGPRHPERRLKRYTREFWCDLPFTTLTCNHLFPCWLVGIFVRFILSFGHGDSFRTCCLTGTFPPNLSTIFAPKVKRLWIRSQKQIGWVLGKSTNYYQLYHEFLLDQPIKVSQRKRPGNPETSEKNAAVFWNMVKSKGKWNEVDHCRIGFRPENNDQQDGNP